MNTVRITIRQAELDEILAFLFHYTHEHGPAQVRLGRSASERANIVARLIPTLCARLSIRLATARLAGKSEYRMNLPGELALALVHAWVEQGGDRWPSARVLIGNLHRNLQ